MNSRNHKYALLLVAAVAVSATGAMSQAFAQHVSDGMESILAIQTNVGLMMAKAT